MKKRINLQLFADGGEGGTAAGAATNATAGNSNGGQNAGGSATYTFEQAEGRSPQREHREQRQRP